MACWTSSGLPYLDLNGGASRVGAAVLPVPRPRPYAYAAEPIPTRATTMVDVGRAEETRREFENAGRLPTSLAGFKLLKAGRNMSRVQGRWAKDIDAVGSESGRTREGCCIALKPATSLMLDWVDHRRIAKLFLVLPDRRMDLRS